MTYLIHVSGRLGFSGRRKGCTASCGDNLVFFFFFFTFRKPIQLLNNWSSHKALVISNDFNYITCMDCLGDSSIKDSYTDIADTPFI